MLFFTFVYYPHRLAFRLRKRTFVDEFYAWSEQNFVFQSACDLFCERLKLLEVIGKQAAQFHLDEDLVIAVYILNGNQIVVAKLGELHQYLLYLHREDVHAFYDKHIVAATFDAIYAAVCASAGATAG